MRRYVIQTAYADGSDRIPKGAIDWTRFKKNPVVLFNHDWSSPPVGLLTEINEKLVSGLPRMHMLTEDSKSCYRLLRTHKVALYPGGEAVRDEHGKITSFKLYEVSICAK